MPHVNDLVVVKGIIADFSEFIAVEVGSKLQRCTVEPVLSVPVFGGATDCFVGDWSVDMFFAPCIILDFVLN